MLLIVNVCHVNVLIVNVCHLFIVGLTISAVDRVSHSSRSLYSQVESIVESTHHEVESVVILSSQIEIFDSTDFSGFLCSSFSLSV